MYPLARLSEVITALGVQLGIIAVPADYAQQVADALVANGVKGILNFAPATLNVPEHISLASVDLAVHLEQLAFRISASQLANPR